MLVGSLLAPLGVLLISLGWLGSAHTPVVQEQISYLISGGLLGVSLVVLGGFLYFSHWQTQQVRVTQAQTGQVVDALRTLQESVDRLSASFDLKPALVATPEGTISHLPTCSVVRGRSDLHTVNGELSPCKICQPA